MASAVPDENEITKFADETLASFQAPRSMLEAVLRAMMQAGVTCSRVNGVPWNLPGSRRGLGSLGDRSGGARYGSSAPISHASGNLGVRDAPLLVCSRNFAVCTPHDPDGADH